MMILFCQDGTLRIQSNMHETALPATFIQKELNQNDFQFFAPLFKSEFKFEKGLTFGSFVKNIEPWVAFFSTLCQKDISSFISEMKKPCDTQKVEKGACILISADKLINIKKKSMQSFQTISDYVNKANIEPSAHIEVESYVTVSEVKPNDPEQYALTFAKFNELRDMPLKIMTDCEYAYLPFHKEKASLLNKNHSHVKVNRHQFLCMYATLQLDFYTLITQFWNNFMYSVGARQEEEKQLMRAMQSIPELKEEVKAVSTSDESKVKSVVFADGAFDSMLEHIQAERDNWDKLVTSAKKNNVIIRIGSFEENTVAYEGKE